MTVIFLIRHAEAGRRQEWAAPDDQRPLTEEGEHQAWGIMRLLGGEGTGPVLTSPYVRCVQSVAPLAVALEAQIDKTDVLAEGASPEAALAALVERAGPVYGCTHGDVVEGILGLLDADGVPLEGKPPAGEETRKGATWVLECEAGHIVSGRLLPPPS